jgi:esterase/lipase
LDKIEVPVLILQGENDVMFPPKVAKDFYDSLRGCKNKRLEIIKGSIT